MGAADARVPDDKLPQCWSDDVRMNALFAPFRLKSANPESWDMKMKFWSDMLRVWCKCRGDPIVSAAEAKVAFQRKGRTPACIDIVVEECYRSNELSPISKYQQILHNGPEGWVRWGARLAFKPAALAITAVSLFLPKKTAVDSDGLPKATIQSTQRFVLESAVEDQAMQLLENYPPGVERIGTIEQLMHNSGYSSKEVFEVLLGWLVGKGLAVKKGDYVKIAESSTKVDPITETDEALVRLLQAEEKLTRDATRLTRDAKALAADAKAALQLGNRLAAKNHLRRKQTLQQRALKCENALENVRQLLHNVREMEVNKAVVDTYKMSSDAMKRGMAQGGLSEDSVLDTMDDLKEVLESYNDVEKALSTPVEDSDAADLEEELKELLAGGGGGGGGTGREEDGDESLDLPSPPRQSKTRKPSERDFIYDGEERMLAELNELGMNESPRGKERLDVRARRKIAVAETEDWRPEEGKKSTPKDKPSKSWYPPGNEFTKDSNLDKSLDELCSSFDELRTDQRLHPGQKLDIDFTSPPALYKNDFQIQDHTRDERVWLYNSAENREQSGNMNISGNREQSGDRVQSGNTEKSGNRDSIGNMGRTRNMEISGNRESVGERMKMGASTEYFSPSSPVGLPPQFQMAPGGERKPSAPWGRDEAGEQCAPEGPFGEQCTPDDMDDLQARLNSLRGL